MAVDVVLWLIIAAGVTLVASGANHYVGAYAKKQVAKIAIKSSS